MLLKIHPENPQQRLIVKVVDILNDGGIVIIPTDTVYAFATNPFKKSGVEKLCMLKKLDPSKATFSFLGSNLSILSEYTKPIPNEIFRLMKSVLPGPYTFILPINSKIPKILENRRKTIGIRIPDNKIVQAIVDTIGHPIVSSSIRVEEQLGNEYISDPELIYERYLEFVDAVVDGGPGSLVPSTVIDATEDMPILIRKGLGPVDFLDLIDEGENI
ncbi:MAG: L-threonylcarbamoyladenylate synthase [Bacteroidales bacterium]|jgi:tRNA threonylcarbamoyl adenosine modification protein (Sua5/YciO/YrdC/YwlC family)|nr:threonylcarbamoyl-AMP synthase [Bacteroidales bacterium]MDI9576178.1 L-threonylcarbamoyladenylate synthase [Bacteroidota bacterium]MDD2593154.1 L-threonylcarbamoyladenylate synthase [Bacteroidales bacterium]MDD3755532.1 L-threonylcarbamoyladenylate synthase [Bacteroidales bacterium]MDY0400681.1 L-threonylcarbamoyladenylate synthase [Bacteroidales bacterium]